MRVETTITINRPMEEVMNFLTRIENLPSWAENVVEAEQTSKGPVGLGTTCRIVSEIMQRRLLHEFAVTEFSPGESYSAHSTSGPFPMSLTYSVSAAGEGTRLSSVSEVKPTGVMALAASAMRTQAQARFESDHLNLKRILES